MKTLIILPHCDDEIGIIPLLLNNSSKFNYCDFLFLSSDDDRLSESNIFLEYVFSSQDLHYNIFRCPLNLTDGKMYEKFDQIFTYINNISKNYDIVCSPFGERGHQDHDIAFLVTSSLIGQEKYYFNLYRSNKILYYFAFSSDYHPELSIIKIKLNSKLALRCLKNLFHFKSQLLQIFLILPFYIYRVLKGFNYAYSVSGESDLSKFRFETDVLYFKRNTVDRESFNLFLDQFFKSK